jgi:uncharacterized protein
MDSALIVSALLMGLAGGPHCAAMCGAAHGAIAHRGGAAQAHRALVALQFGRLASYAAAGALVAMSVGWVRSFEAAAPLLRPLWTMLHVAAIALGLWLLWAGRAPAWLAQATRQSKPSLATAQPLRFFARMPVTQRAGLLGLCWALMPCGLLQSALVVAALASGPWQGAGVMAGFAVASSLSLWLAPRLWLRYGARGRALGESVLPVRLAGGLLAGASIFALAHGLGAAIAQALCLPGA